jgi:hypothetical protein
MSFNKNSIPWDEMLQFRPSKPNDNRKCSHGLNYSVADNMIYVYYFKNKGTALKFIGSFPATPVGEKQAQKALQRAERMYSHLRGENIHWE